MIIWIILLKFNQEEAQDGTEPDCQIICQPSDILGRILDFIPKTIDPAHQKSSKDFSRTRKLPC